MTGKISEDPDVGTIVGTEKIALVSAGVNKSGTPAEIAAYIATLAQTTGKAPLASPTFTGNPTAPTPAVDDNDTSIATTAYVIGQASAVGDGTPAMDGTAARGSSTHFARADHVHPTDTSLAPKASPALTGTPTAPTAAPGTNTTQISTTAFVQAAVTALIGGAPGALDTLDELAAAINDDASYAAAITTALGLKAPLLSPALTGTPTAPTAAVGTNTTQIATTAMVIGQAASATPLGDSPTAAVGTSTRYARADHVHFGREVLTANRTYYVRSDGSNSNTGLVDSAGGAFLTIQKAIDTLATLDCSNFQVTITVNAGTWTTPIVLTRCLGTLPPILTGVGSTTIISTTSATAILNDGGGSWQINNLKIQTTTSGHGMNTRNGGVIKFSALEFGAHAAGGNHMYAQPGSSIQWNGSNYLISGGGNAHLSANGYISVVGAGVTVSNTPAWTTAFAQAGRGSVIDAFSMTFTGTGGTGSKYAASANGVLFSLGGESSFPGNSTTASTTGGQVI